MITLLNPWICAALAAAGLPVIIHLLTKAKLLQIRWAATKFLMVSVEKNRRKQRIEDLLLLLLRCLIIALLVIIFARPALMVLGGLNLSPEPITAVILLDQSASMGQSDGRQTRFADAKSKIQDLLAKLFPGSDAALFLVSDTVKQSVARPTQDIGLLRHVLDQAKLTDRPTDFLPAISSAVDVLAPMTGTRREIFLVTDNQQLGWQKPEAIQKILRGKGAGIEVHCLTVGTAGEDNLAITALETNATVAVMDQPLNFSVRVTNYGRSAVSQVLVKLAVDRDAPQNQAMVDHLEPHETKAVTLSAKIHQAGTHSVTATLPDDPLPADNHRSLALRVVDREQVLIVEGTSHADVAKQDGFFLKHALQPVNSQDLPKYYLQVTIGHPADLDQLTPQKYSVVILSNVGRLGAAAVQALHKYVEAGGGLAIFPGPATDPDSYNSPEFQAILPAKLSPLHEVTENPKYITLQSKGYDHPVTNFWNDAENGSLGSVRFSKYFPLVVAAGPGSDSGRVVLKYSDGEIALAERRLGQGRVWLFGSTATPQWNSLPLHPAFVPLMLRGTGYLMKASAGNINLKPGEPFSAEVDFGLEGANVAVLRPGEKQRLTFGRVEAAANQMRVQYSDTEVAGVYSLWVGDEAEPHFTFAVQGDPTESDLTQQGAKETDDLLQGQPATAPGTAPAGAAPPPVVSQQKVPGAEIWLPLAILLLVLALVESGMAHLSSRPK